MSANEAVFAAGESVWLDANRFYEAESRYIEVAAAELRRRANPGRHNPSSSTAPPSANTAGDSSGGDLCSLSLEDHLKKLQKGQEQLQQKVCELESDSTKVFGKLSALEKSLDRVLSRLTSVENSLKGSVSGIQNGSPRAADNDDDLDLFGSDEEVDDAAAKVREERLQAYANKKAKKPALVAKSSVVLDVKPWDDETDLKAMEKAVRGIETDGLVWGASKLVPLAYGIKKLQIVAVVEDEKVSIDWLQEAICEMEDLVQSVDVAAFNKL